MFDFEINLVQSSIAHLTPARMRRTFEDAPCFPKVEQERNGSNPGLSRGAIAGTSMIFGGLRCPSKVVVLRWEDVNWERNCFYVRSSKTEQHEGGESRIVPIFPELKAELEKLFFNLKSEGKQFVINRYRSPKQNLGTTFAKIAVRAGLPEIPRPFDNMRMTRSNEIYNRFGAFKESQWIGHSGRVRQDHYLMIQDSDIDEASQWQNLTQKANDGKSDKPE